MKDHVFNVKVLNGFQTTLYAAGLFPGFGEIADGINGLIYTARGDKVSAALSYSAMIPIVGSAGTAGKWINKGADAVDDVSDAAGKTNKSVNDGVVTKVTDNVGTPPRYGDRRISNDLYNELRDKTPSSKIQKMVNEGAEDKIGTPDPALSGKYITGTLQADHIVSMKNIARMENFNNLTKEQQLMVLNNPENFIGLSVVCQH